MKTKITILILSIIYCAYLLTALAASHYASAVLNPLNSEYHYKNGNLIKAIESEPAKAEYHMDYGLELIKSLPNDKFAALNQLRLAKEEFFRAAKLRPYDQLYKNAYNIYTVWIDEQFSKMR
ncbi:MAG: hypothetical protein PHS66_03665 [Candidatus Omnitrophica bacterium]|nr:hypothetical protein [Candidatus Omnitrophota bacterium]